ncbi:MAG TPA: helix-turn-helix domain-containing protein, partial [Polyangiales bacterium]
MRTTRDWLSAREAVQRLDVKLPTLYSYVSRGLVKSVPAPGGRRRLYAFADVERLKARHDARAGHTAVAASALRWGEPTFTTGISDIRADGPCYRGVPVASLLESAASFECVAELLLTGSQPAQVAPASIPVPLLRTLPRRARAQLRIGQLAADVARLGLRDLGPRTPAADLTRTRWLFGWLAARGAPQRRRTSSVAARL